MALNDFWFSKFGGWRLQDQGILRYTCEICFCIHMFMSTVSMQIVKHGTQLKADTEKNLNIVTEKKNWKPRIMLSKRFPLVSSKVSLLEPYNSPYLLVFSPYIIVTLSEKFFLFQFFVRKPFEGLVRATKNHSYVLNY